MEFKIINGIRHYRMNPNEPWKVDNLSQAEAEIKFTRPEPVKPQRKPQTQPIQNNLNNRTQKQPGHTYQSTRYKKKTELWKNFSEMFL